MNTSFWLRMRSIKRVSSTNHPPFRAFLLTRFLYFGPFLLNLNKDNWVLLVISMSHLLSTDKTFFLDDYGYMILSNELFITAAAEIKHTKWLKHLSKLMKWRSIDKYKVQKLMQTNLWSPIRTLLYHTEILFSDKMEIWQYISNILPMFNLSHH